MILLISISIRDQIDLQLLAIRYSEEPIIRQRNGGIDHSVTFEIIHINRLKGLYLHLLLFGMIYTAKPSAEGSEHEAASPTHCFRE
jgi:hypothetical protein